jgi:broad specificity phosphatase PhoE
MAEEIWIVRHGETEWSRSGQHTGVTDVELTDAGRDQARALGDQLRDADFSLVLTSASRRARHTAELAGFGAGHGGSGPALEVDDDLAEMRYGSAEGRTTAEMREEHPDWVVWDGANEGAESLHQAAERMGPLVGRLRAAEGRVLVVGHGHASRVLAARWIGVTEVARHLVALGTGRVGILGYDHEDPAIQAWNVP